MLGFKESGVCLRWFMRSSLVEIKPSTLNLQTSSFWRFSDMVFFEAEFDNEFGFYDSALELLDL